MLTSAHRTKVRYLALYTVVFLAVAVLAFWPFQSQGRTFIYYFAGQERDGFTQHYTAFVYIGRYIREFVCGLFRGQFALKHFDFTLGYGEDVIQSLGYYGFGDPLMLLSALVPQRLVSSFYHVYILLELWLAGLSFAWFGREKGYEAQRLLPCSLIYVFSGFALWAGLCHPEFLAPMIWFPLMLVGIERVLDGKRPVFLAVITAIYALTGYYWLYMGTLFVCLYALVRFWEEKRGWKALGGFFLRAAGGYALGLMLAAPLFLPNVIGFLQSNRTGGERGVPPLLVTGEQAQSVLRLLIAPGTWNFAGLCALVLPALLLLFVRREKKYRGWQVLTGLLSLFCLVPVVGWLCNAGAYETTRWYVFLDFFAAVAVLIGLDELAAFRSRGIMCCALGVLLYTWAAWNAGETEQYALAALMVGIVVLLLLGLLRGKMGERMVCALLTVLVAGNCVGNARVALTDYVPMFAPWGLVEAEVAAMPANLVPDGEAWQRVDQDYSNNPNASMLLDYAGVASYFSTSNGNTARFLSDMEIPLHNKVLFPNLDSRTFLNAVLATRWFAGAEQGGRSVPYGYEQIGEGMWEDRGALPLGFTYDTIVDEEDWTGLSALERQELMLQAAYAEGLQETGEVPRSRLSRVELTGTALQNADWQDGQLNAYGSGAGLTVEFSGLPGCETYLRLKNVSLAWADTPQLSVTVQAGQMETRYTFSSENFLWHSGQESVLINLGYSPEGLSRAELIFEQPGGLKLDDLEVWCQPMDEYESWRDDLRRESVTGVQVDVDHIAGKISTTGRRVLAFAIPYSPGWDIYIDGQRTDSLRVNDVLLGVELEAGEHVVELWYHSPGFRLGTCLSAVGLCVLVPLLLYRRKDRKAV